MTKKRLSTFAKNMHTALKTITSARRDERDVAIDLARQLLRIIGRDRTKVKEGPIRAFCAEIEGLTALYLPARSPGEARWRIVKEQRDAGFRALFSAVRITRARMYDSWAQWAKHESHTADSMPVSK